ncbi:MAG: hypothetical protein R2741_01900 [Methanolobus sp.]
MKFTSNDGSRRQFFFMFGRSTGDIEVNGRYVEGSRIVDNRTDGYCVSWAYDGAYRKITDDLGMIEVNDNMVACSNEDVQAEFYGSFPEYRLEISDCEKNICSFTIDEPAEDRYTTELMENFKGLFGYRVANLYFDFKGMLFDKELSGKCYVQKVIVVGPMLPWKWSRIIFSNGSVLTYYTSNIGVIGLDYEIRNFMSFYDATTKKMHNFKKAMVHEHPSGLGDNRWVITTEDHRVFVVTKGYCSETFNFTKNFNFNYVENLVDVVDLRIEVDDRLITLEETGEGLGMVEDTSGFVM